MEITNFTLWKNKFKKTEKQPDYIIRHKDANDQWQEIGAGWKKEVKGKVDEQGKPVSYLSCQLKAPLSEEDKAAIAALREEETKKANQAADNDFDNIPF